MDIEVNIDELRFQIDRLNQLLENYEMTILNLYNQENSTLTFWRDRKSLELSNNSVHEKAKVKNMLTELSSLKEVYKYIVEKYQQIGNKIQFNLNNQNQIVNIFNRCIDKENVIINLYSNINVRYCYYELRILNNEKQRMIAHRNKLIEVKNNIVSQMNNIQRSEREIRDKISAINIEILLDNDNL